jgi:hypothetical protein
MKPCTITPVRPIRDMNRIRSEVQAWARFVLAVLVLSLLVIP